MTRNVMTGVYSRNGEDFEFSFYTSLSAANKIRFVKTVSNLLIDDNYYSIIKDLIFDFEIIDIFTDVDIKDIIESESNSIGMIEDLLHESNIVDIVKANVEDGIIEELYNAVNDNIEYRTGIHKNSFIDRLNHLLRIIETKISGVDTDSLMQVAQTLGSISGELTADKIVKAYANSDLFKERYNQSLKEKEKRDTVLEALAEEIRNKKK